MCQSISHELVITRTARRMLQIHSAFPRELPRGRKLICFSSDEEYRDIGHRQMRHQLKLKRDCRGNLDAPGLGVELNRTKSRVLLLSSRFRAENAKLRLTNVLFCLKLVMRSRNRLYNERPLLDGKTDIFDRFL